MPIKRLWKKGLVIGIIVLFIGTNIVSSLNIQLKNTTNPLICGHGNTLYVGGSGSGNYSKIQDAIDNASDGDTVFVYNGIYIEHPCLEVNKSINLLGEDKNTTIIDNQEYYDVVHLGKDGIKIDGFTIKNSYKEFSGIVYNSSYIIISNNIIENNYIGIESLYYSSEIIICYNEIISNYFGISLYLSRHCKINHNIIKNNIIAGLSPEYEGDHNITLNSFINNNVAIFSNDCSNCSITKNNFIDNTLNLISYCDNTFYWNNNYWDKPRILPKKLIAWKVVYDDDPYIVPYYMVDYNPALKPYNILKLEFKAYFKYDI